MLLKYTTMATYLYCWPLRDLYLMQHLTKRRSGKVMTVIQSHLDYRKSVVELPTIFGEMAMTKATTLTDGLWEILKTSGPIAAGACASAYFLIGSTTHTHRASPQQTCCTFQVTLTESMNLHVFRPISIC